MGGSLSCNKVNIQVALASPGALFFHLAWKDGKTQKKTTRYYGIQWRLDGGSHDGWKKQVLKGSRGSFSGHNMELILMDAQLSSNLCSHHKEPASAPLKKTYEKNGTSYFFGSAQNLLKNLRHFQTASFAVSQAIDFTVSLRMQNMAVVGKVSDFFGERRRGRK